MATYYVNSDSGNDDNSGVSQNFPYKTLAKALTVSTSADTIRLKGGLNYEISGDDYAITSLRSFIGDTKNPVIIWTNPEASKFLFDISGLNFTAYNITFKTNLSSVLSTASIIRISSSSGSIKIYNCIFNDPYVNSFLNDLGVGSITVYNSIFRDNYLILKNGNFVGSDKIITIYNSILDNCGLYQISRFTGSNNCLFGFSDFGTNNVTTDPLFVDATNYDYRLQDGSDCLGAGTTTQNGTNLYSPPASNLTTNDIGVYGGANMLEYNPATASGIVYCNTDLKRYYTNIDEFDLKKTLMDEWTHITDGLFKYYDSGTVTKLYKDGVDLGDPQSSEDAVTEVGDWYYDSDGDYIYIKCSGEVCNSEMQVAPMDWSDAKTMAIADASEWLEGILDNRFPRPLPKNSNGTYDFILERICGMYACLLLIRTSNPESSVINAIWYELYNDEKTGLVQLLNSGKIKLAFEITQSDRGMIEVGSLDATTTGSLTDTQGSAQVQYEKYKAQIITGGTLTTGVENTTVTYKVIDSQGQEVVGTTLIDGYYQTIGGGIMARFTPGVYVADDYWFVTVTALPSTTQTVRTIRLRR